MARVKSTSQISWENYVEYDETSPSGLRWKVDTFTGKNFQVKISCAGDVAGTVNSSGYWIFQRAKVLYLCHRVIWEMHNSGLSVDEQIDHVDGCRTNNLIANLRIISHTGNMRNKGMYKNNKSGVAGVSLTRCGKYWKAQWYNLEKDRKTGYFSVVLLGYEEAFRLACKCREDAIQLLNSMGAGYTEGHGVRL